MTNSTNGHLLIADDEPTNLDILVDIFEGDYELSIAVDGEQALELARSGSPDLILLDVMMPVIDGYEVLSKLKDRSETSDIPVIFITGLGADAEQVRGFKLGAVDFISKPISPPVVKARVRHQIELKKANDKLRRYHERTTAELALATAMQEQLMPQSQLMSAVYDQLGICIASHFAPSSELGGDFWGLRYDDRGRLVIWMVDFSGHGVGAALNTFRLHAIINQMSLVNFDPAIFLENLNQSLRSLLPVGQFATVLAGVFDQESNNFQYASAAAPKPMLWHSGDTHPILGGNSGLPLGVFDNPTYTNRVLDFLVGGSLFLYSDAITELQIGGDILDEIGLKNLVIRHMAASDDRPFLQELLESLATMGKFDDDVTALVFTREH